MADESGADGEGWELSTAAAKEAHLRQQAIQMALMLPTNETDARKALHYLEQLVDEFIYPKNSRARPTIVKMRPDEKPGNKA